MFLSSSHTHATTITFETLLFLVHAVVHTYTHNHFKHLCRRAYQSLQTDLGLPRPPRHSFVSWNEGEFRVDLHELHAVVSARFPPIYHTYLDAYTKLSVLICDCLDLRDPPVYGACFCFLFLLITPHTLWTLNQPAVDIFMSDSRPVLCHLFSPMLHAPMLLSGRVAYTRIGDGGAGTPSVCPPRKLSSLKVLLWSMGKYRKMRRTLFFPNREIIRCL